MLRNIMELSTIHHSSQLAIRFQGEHFYNFFEVGEIRLADSAGIARWSKVGEGFQIIQPIETVEYPTKAGGITCLGGWEVEKQIADSFDLGVIPYNICIHI
jgi:hypothetical protein